MAYCVKCFILCYDFKFSHLFAPKWSFNHQTINNKKTKHIKSSDWYVFPIKQRHVIHTQLKLDLIFFRTGKMTILYTREQFIILVLHAVITVNIEYIVVIYLVYAHSSPWLYCRCVWCLSSNGYRVVSLIFVMLLPQYVAICGPTPNRNKFHERRCKQ